MLWENKNFLNKNRFQNQNWHYYTICIIIIIIYDINYILDNILKSTTKKSDWFNRKPFKNYKF